MNPSGRPPHLFYHADWLAVVCFYLEHGVMFFSQE
jgi:hypothetical protein